MDIWLLGAARLLLAAQTTQASIVGMVRDGESGEPLPGAVVALTDLDRATISGADGRYALDTVPPGPQHVTVRRIGYTPRTLHALVPPYGELEIDIALRAEPALLPAVDVRPAVSVRGLDDSEGATFPDRGISAAAIRNHPLLAEPDALLALGGGEIVLRPESPSGMHLRGGASDQTTYLLDGIPVFSPYHAAGTFSAWNPDAIGRLEVFSALSSPALPEALSGAVTAVTRTPGERSRAQGSISTTQARATADGPLGVAGAGYLVSMRSGFPGFIAPEREPSYLMGENSDLLAKVEVPVFGGRARLLGYESENELDAAAVAESADPAGSDRRRNAFGWYSRSLGAEWAGRAGAVSVRVRAWSASGDADATWNPGGGARMNMAAGRRDDGVVAVVDRMDSASTTLAGLRVLRSRTSFRVTSAGDGTPSLALSARTPVSAVFVQHERTLGRGLTTNFALSATAAMRSVYASPQAQLRWRASRRLTLSGSYGRSHQFAQSLRNPESLAGTIFPVDLYVGAGATGVPVARSDRGVLAVDLRAFDGVRLGAQAYVRDFDGLLLVAPRTGEPFASAGLTTGSGIARGLAVEAAMSGTRYGLVASYGWQRLRLDHGDSSYVPGHGASHLVEAGVVFFPSATASIRFGATGIAGRRATVVIGPLEWEACNLLDRGCELGGSPRHATDRLGRAKLPPYLRLDVGLRKHWHLKLGRRDALVAVFGTVTNVLGRKNVLTVVDDPATAERAEIGMRPLAPLVVGIDWRF